MANPPDRFVYISYAASLLAFGLIVFAQTSPFDQITLQRTACYGLCPDYTLTIAGDGRVTYEGRQFVKVVGTQHAVLKREEIGALVEALAAVRYFELRDTYASQADGCATVWTDNPSVITSVTAAGRKKEIRHYHGCQTGGPQGTIFPAQLAEFEDAIDRIVDSRRWTRGN